MSVNCGMSVRRPSEDRVRRAGCVVTELDAREKERFQEAAAPMYEKILF